MNVIRATSNYSSTAGNVNQSAQYSTNDSAATTYSLNNYEVPKYSIFEIANWFLSKENMTHKKVQKLCYYAQAWYYALKGDCLTDGAFEAWVHGPVSPKLYGKFKAYGFNCIKLVGNYHSNISLEDTIFLNDIWETYGDHDGNSLEALSHSEQPWIEARSGCREDDPCNNIISKNSMIKYYNSIYLGGNK